MKRQFCLLLIVLIVFPAIGYGEENPDQDKGLDKNASKTNTMESIAKILDAIVWPLVILIIVILLRKKVLERLLDRLANRLESIKYGSAEAKFIKEALEQGEKSVEDAVEEPPQPPPEEEVVKSTENKEPRPIRSPFVSLVKDGRLESTMEYRYLNDILQHSARSAVIAAWYYAENALVSLAKAIGIEDAENEYYSNIFVILTKMKLLINNTMELYSKFNNIRDVAMVTQNFDEVMDENGPERYITVTLQLAARLQEAEEHFRNNS